MMKSFFALSPLLLWLSLSPGLRAQDAGRAQQAPAKPAATETPAPLPDISTLLYQVESARQHNTTMMENYFFNATTTVHENSGKTETRVSEISYIHGVRLERLIEKNGKPLAPDEAAKEKERSDKAQAKAKARIEKAQAKGIETDSNGNELISLNRLLELYSVSNERREMVRGRSAIVFDFTGNHAVKTKSIPEGMLQSMNGTIWIDEKDHQIAKMTGTMANGYRVGFGMIISISKGAGGTIEFAPVNNEVWLPLRMEGSGHARLFLVDDALDGTESTVFSNFHKFGSDIRMLPAENSDSGASAPAADKP